MPYRLVYYDVSCDKRRRKLHKRLKGLLTPIQKSAFEGWLPAPKMAALEALILEELDLEHDVVRVASLCRGCHLQLQGYGDMPRMLAPGEIVLI